MRADGLNATMPPRAPQVGEIALGTLLLALFAVARGLAGAAGDARQRQRYAEQSGDLALRPRDEAHGRGAHHPREIPRRGWRDILIRVKDDFSRTNLSLIASGVAFFAFLAVPSAFAALVAVYGLAFDPSDVAEQIQALQGVLPEEAAGVLRDQLATLTAHSRASLGIGFVVTFCLAVWSARSATSSLITAINIAYDEEEKRSFLSFQVAALGLTLGGIVAVLVSLALIAVLPAVLDILPLGAAGKTIAAVAPWPILVVLVMVGLAALYRYAPCRAEPRWRWVSWGAVAATVLWIAASVLFSAYVAEFATYDKTYGSLGAVVVLLMWLYLSVLAVLLGAELNAEIEHQTARDSTTGAPKPMGQRGATMADTLGRTR